MSYAHQHGRVRREDVIELCPLSGRHVSTLLTHLRDAGKLVTHGAKRGSYYTIGPDNG